MKRIRGNSHRLLVSTSEISDSIGHACKLEVSVRPARMMNVKVLNKINISR